MPWESSTPGPNPCTHCHGDATRNADPLVQAAPPNNIYGNSDPATPGVGAHLNHLLASETHAAVACAECHIVPERTTSPGHDDTAGPAELTFGALASRGRTRPTYDPLTHTCGNTYCHGQGTSPQWNKARSSAEACGSCHGLPPPLPHPQSQACEKCHGSVVAAGLQIVSPALHVNGTVDVVQADCNVCHGSNDGPAPPRSLDGGTNPDVPGVGAHTAHLRGGQASRAVKCEECHRVPTKVDDPGHLNGGPAELTFSGVALGPDGGDASYARSTRTCTTWCHSAGAPDAGSPTWTRVGGALACDGCHGAPPPAPHPAVAQCNLCHANAISPTTLANLALHVNGIVEVSVPQACDACHGSAANPAPPRDTKGNVATSFKSVGAHQAHLVGTGFSRRPLCGECHVVPAQVVAPGHLDGVTQVVFSGVALTAGSTPSYSASAGTCANSWCHDTRPLTGNASNGGQYQVPSWTRLDGAQIQCTSCHGYPPSAPHPQQGNCGSCHSTMDGGSIAIPSRHIDGRLDF